MKVNSNIILAPSILGFNHNTASEWQAIVRQFVFISRDPQFDVIDIHQIPEEIYPKQYLSPHRLFQHQRPANLAFQCVSRRSSTFLMKPPYNISLLSPIRHVEQDTKMIQQAVVAVMKSPLAVISCPQFWDEKIVSFFIAFLPSPHWTYSIN
jgi:hypothetical protein